MTWFFFFFALKPIAGAVVAMIIGDFLANNQVGIPRIMPELLDGLSPEESLITISPGLSPTRSISDLEIPTATLPVAYQVLSFQRRLAQFSHEIE